MTANATQRAGKGSSVLLSFIVGGLAVASAASANAQVIYDSLGSPSGSDQIQISSYDFDSFTPTANETLSGVELGLGSYPTTGATGTLNVGLYTLSNLGIANPTLITSLGTINNSAISTAGIFDYAVPLTTDPNLTAGTRYWIGVSDFADGAAVWYFNSNLSGVGESGEYWADNGGIVSPNTAGNGPFQMELTVPDQTQSAPLLALGAAGLALLAWKPVNRRSVMAASSRPQAP